MRVLHTPREMLPPQPAHSRSYSSPVVAPRVRTRKTSAPLLLLHISTAPPTVDVTRLDSPSLASFTPSSDDLGGAAHGSLRAHIAAWQRPRRRTRALSDAPEPAAPPPTRPRFLSLFTAPTPAPAPVPISFPVHPPSDSPLALSPTASIPSISRTHSSATSSSLPPTPPLRPLRPLTAPPDPLHLSLKPARRRRRTPSLPTPSPSPTSPRQSLANLEATSKLMRARTSCAMCGRLGPDFPRCPWCGDAWCSRECRIAARGKAAEGRGHGCKGKRVAASSPRA